MNDAPTEKFPETSAAVKNAEDERAAIRAAMKAVANGMAGRDAMARAIDNLALAIRQRLAAEPAINTANAEALLVAALGKAGFRTLTAQLEAAARDANARGTPAEEMERDLAAITFGVRVLELRAEGMLPMAAMQQAHEEAGGDGIENSYLRQSQWNPFRDLVQRKGFVPYFSIDPGTGEMAPTRFVPSQLDGKSHRGAPRGPRKK